MKRGLKKGIENNLRKSSLWEHRLYCDCKAQKVFLAIRDNQIGFYHKGGRLFCFDSNGFKTHLKYAAVIAAKKEEEYVIENELQNYELATDFKTNYKLIKKICSKYSGMEDSGVSKLYHKYSYLSNSNVVVLDIEVSFESLNKKKKRDTIDILLYNKETQTLQFVEAKHYSSKEILSETIPEVISQIKRYESQIAARKSEILSAYIEYVKILNRFFDIKLPEPKAVEDKVTLLIFGFDNDQKKGRLKELIKNIAYSEIKYYSKGDISKDVVLERLWSKKV